jgi:hypothetical protein
LIKLRAFSKTHVNRIMTGPDLRKWLSFLKPDAKLPAQSSGNPRRDERFRLMQQHFLQHVDPRKTRGLEIGAFDLPLVEPQEGTCDFADYHSTEELRRMAGELEGPNPEFVVPVSYVTANGYAEVPNDYDWIAACHVIEHIADFIGWLQLLASHLRPGGTLFVGMPDKRYTFDIHRQVTTFSEAVAAHHAQLTRPSFSQVFDFVYLYATGLSPPDVWKGKSVPPPERNFGKALKAARSAENQYYDVHCSVFTPASFKSLMTDIIAAGLIPYELISLRETAPKTIDFSAVLRRT